MKVLQINCVYGQGSTGKITKDIHVALQKAGIESYVCYGRGRKNEDQNVIRITSDLASRTRKVIAMVDGMPYRFSRLTNRKLEKEIQRLKPDIVHLQCINGYFTDIYRLLDYLKRHHIPTILTLHAEFMYTGGCGLALDCIQWKKGCRKCNNLKQGLDVIGIDRVEKNYRRMQQCMEEFENLYIVGVSNWISNRATQSQIMDGKKIQTIHNGIDTRNVFYKRVENDIREKYGIPHGKKIIMAIIPSLRSAIKGGEVFIELSKNSDKNVEKYVIVGLNEEVKNKPDNLIIIPHTNNQQELAELYSIADVFVMCSKQDNYPTVCIEANSCGTPVVGFDVGGVSETIYPGMGEVVPYGNIAELQKKIVEWSNVKSNISDSLRNEVIRKNSKERMVEEYVSLYYKVLGRK